MRSLIPVTTQGEGDCAFHAALGKKGKEKEAPYVCQNVAAERETLAGKIRTCSQKNKGFYQSVKQGIEGLIRARKENPSTINLNQRSHPTILAKVDTYQGDMTPLGNLLADKTVLIEYATYIATPGIWLLTCELSMIAYAFDQTIFYYTGDNPHLIDIYNPDQQKTRPIYFNGIDHYEAMEAACSNKKNNQPRVADSKKSYDKGGVTNSLHGVIYQLKLLMLFLSRGEKTYEQFQLATEMNAAEKFDDIVFFYEEKGEKKVRFVQAKHKQHENTVISAKDLLSKNSQDEFFLGKYFVSYQRIKKKAADPNNQLFSGHTLEEFCLCTNIGFNWSQTEDLDFQQGLELMKESDPILHFEGSHAQRYRFKQGNFSGKQKLYAAIKQYGDEQWKLAEAFAGLGDNQPINRTKAPFNNLALIEHLTTLTVLEKDKDKYYLTTAFKNNTGLSEEAQEIRTLYPTAKKVWRLTQALVAGKNGQAINTKSEPFNEPLIQQLTKDGVLKIKEDKYYLTDAFTKNKDLSKEAQKIRTIYQKVFDKESKQSTITDEEIEDFLQHLVFAVNQPNEVKLGDIIAKEQGEAFKLLNSKLIYSEYQHNTLNWMKLKTGQCLTQKNAKDFVEEIKGHIARLTLMGLTQSYQAKLEGWKIHFEDSTEITTFLKQQETQLMLYKTPGEVTLGAIELYRTLENDSTYKNKDAYLFISLKKAMRLDESFLAAWEKTSLCVLVCEALSEKELDFLSTIFGSLNSISNKKLILVLPQNQDKTIHIPEELSNRLSFGKSNGFSALTKKSQEDLKKKTISFQGHSVTLADLGLDLDTCIDANLLTLLCTDNALSIGRELAALIYLDGQEKVNAETNKTDAVLYMPRTIKLPIVEFPLAVLQQTQDIFLLAGITDTELTEHLGNEFASSIQAYSEELPDNLSQIHHFTIKQSNSTAFNTICNAYPDNAVHQLEWKNTQWIWQKSKGIVSHLRRYIDGNQNQDTTLSGKHVILCADPGMGKSTFITHWAHQVKKGTPQSPPWVIVVPLLSIEAKLKALDAEKINLSDIPTLLLNKPTALECKVFEDWRRKERMAILLDGFDELQTSEQTKMLKILAILKQWPLKQLVITTRKQEQDRLEDALSTFAHDFIPLTDEEAKDLIRAEWFYRLREEEPTDQERLAAINRYIAELIETLRQTIPEQEKNHDPLIGVPLQARLLADAFFTPFKRYWHTPDTGLEVEDTALGDLYQRVIEAKYTLFLEEKSNTTASLHQAPRNELIQGLNRHHQRLAFHFLFPDEPLRHGVPRLNPTQQEWITRAGIVRFDETGQPIFTHRSFAEYLAATFLLKQLEKSSDWHKHQATKTMLLQHIFKPRHQLIQTFMADLIKTSEDDDLANIWAKITACNLTPPSTLRWSFGRQRKAVILPFNDIKTNAWKYKCFSYDKARKYAEAYCKEILTLTDAALLKDSLGDLYNLITSSGIGKVESAIQSYLNKIVLLYVQISLQKGKPIDNSLIRDGTYRHNYPEYNRYYLHLSTWAACDFLDQKQPLDTETINKYLTLIAEKHKERTNQANTRPQPEDVATEQIQFLLLVEQIRHNIGQDDIPEDVVSLQSDMINKLEPLELLKMLAQLTSNIEWIPEPFKNVVFEKIESLFKQKNPNYHDLKDTGITFVQKFKYLSPTMAKVFITENTWNIWRNIWQKLASLLAEKSSVLSEKAIDKIALLTLCAACIKAHATEDQRLSLSPAALCNLLTLTERTLLNRPDDERVTLCVVDVLHALGSVGLLLINKGSHLMVSDPLSDFSYDCDFNQHHQKICEALSTPKHKS